MEAELAEFRRDEERKLQAALRLVDDDIEKQIKEEEERLERLKKIELEDYEQHEKKQGELEARRQE